MTKRKIKKLFEDDLSKTFTPTITAKDIIEKTDYFKYKKEEKVPTVFKNPWRLATISLSIACCILLVISTTLIFRENSYKKYDSSIQREELVYMLKNCDELEHQAKYKIVLNDDANINIYRGTKDNESIYFYIIEGNPGYLYLTVNTNNIIITDNKYGILTTFDINSQEDIRLNVRLIDEESQYYLILESD